MRGITRSPRLRPGRHATAVLLALTLCVTSASISSARPTREDLARARAELAALNERLSLLVEEYNGAKLELQALSRRLDDARAAAAKAREEAQVARDELSERARLAYTGSGSAWAALLDASSLSDFSDRAEFLGHLSGLDADVAARAESARQRSIRASRELDAALAEQQALVETLDAKKTEIQGGIANQQRLIAEIEEELSRPVQPPPAPPQQQEQDEPATQNEPQQEQPAEPQDDGREAEEQDEPEPVEEPREEPEEEPEPPPEPDPEPTEDPDPEPPPASSGAAAAVAAAYSAIGTPYVWGGSSPSQGFDCSGLTMWAWAHAGVSLPHSSAAQYAVLPHISSSQLQPGDLLFFYSPIHHVALYVGGNQVIHATNPSVPVKLETLSSYWWDVYVGAARPG